MSATLSRSRLRARSIPTRFQSRPGQWRHRLGIGREEFGKTGSLPSRAGPIWGVISRKGNTMNDTLFDRWTRGIDARITRRGLGGLGAAALAALGLMSGVEAKKRKKKNKKKNKKKGSGVGYGCANLGAACSNTTVCQCRLNKDSSQVCVDVVNPPGGIIVPCISEANCPAGQFCDFAANVCVRGCGV